jgi:hypothetical protein
VEFVKDKVALQRGFLRVLGFLLEREVLRRIFGPTKERDCTWRIKTNDELIRQEYNKSHNSSKIKLVWPFTSNARRENGKKGIQDVPGGKDLTSGECSLGQTIPI